ncbi:hypothetical protein ACCO45_009877 [Purpureocillium lilacinum]|uniref:Uncharacterized protein n=1 Tax=Purpureocillium lilacinum TaxID=33203 RepID=A0ACC4DIF3_PURLI
MPEDDAERLLNQFDVGGMRYRAGNLVDKPDKVVDGLESHAMCIGRRLLDADDACTDRMSQKEAVIDSIPTCVQHGEVFYAMEGETVAYQHPPV